MTALVGFGFSAYLTYLELFVIDAICQWCVASAILMALSLAVAATRAFAYTGRDLSSAAARVLAWQVRATRGSGCAPSARRRSRRTPAQLARKRRVQYLALAAFAAVAVIVALIVISQSGGSDGSSQPARERHGRQPRSTRSSRASRRPARCSVTPVPRSP